MEPGYAGADEFAGGVVIVPEQGTIVLDEGDLGPEPAA